MGLFKSLSKSKPPKKKLPKGKVEDWTREDVAKWVQYAGLNEYETQFQAITGKRLLQLSGADLYQLVDSKLDANLCLDAINELRASAGLTEQLKPVGTPVGKSAAPKGISLVAVSKASASSNVTALTSEFSKKSSLSLSPSTIALKAGAASRGAAENAELLAGLAGGHDDAKELFMYFGRLGITGAGLVDAAERTPIMGHAVGALAEIGTLAAAARGNRGNCQQLDAFAAELTRAFDFHGKKLAYIDSHALDQLYDSLKQACDLVDSCGQPGWLLRMALNEKSVDEFTAIHNGILSLLQEQGIATLPNGRPLGYGDYHDASRPLRRILKQYGSGSLEEGIKAIRTSTDAVAEMIRLLDVDKQALMRELEAVAAQLHGDSTAGDASAAADVGGRLKEYGVTFHTYDKNRSGALEVEEFQRLLQDLGLLDGLKSSDVEHVLGKQFAAADANHDGRVSFEEFATYYGGLSINKARQQIRAGLGIESEKDLKKVFQDFASFGSRQVVPEMDGSKFFKLCKDTKLMSRTFTVTDVDIIFAKVKAKGARRISFEQFLSALALVADAKRTPLLEVARQVLKPGGPITTGTKSEYVKFHDDKSTYTGVYARGGPSAIDRSTDLGSYLDRSEADVRGVKRSPAPAELISPTSRTPTSHGRRTNLPKPWELQPVAEEEVMEAFMSFANFGTGGNNALSPKGGKAELDGAKFAKLCRETGIQGGKLNSTAVDIIFSKTKPKGARKMGFTEFQAALVLLAEERGWSLEEVRNALVHSSGPARNGVTQAAHVRLHDDKTTYTGVYAKGGPSNVDPKLTLESLVAEGRATPQGDQDLPGRRVWP